MNLRSVLLVAWLTLMWVVLWGDAAPGTVLGGVLVSTAITLAVPPRQPEKGAQIHPWGTLRFVGVRGLEPRGVDVGRGARGRRSRRSPAHRASWPCRCEACPTA